MIRLKGGLTTKYGKFVSSLWGALLSLYLMWILWPTTVVGEWTTDELTFFTRIGTDSGGSGGGAVGH